MNKKNKLIFSSIAIIVISLVSIFLDDFSKYQGNLVFIDRNEEEECVDITTPGWTLLSSGGGITKMKNIDIVWAWNGAAYDGCVASADSGYNCTNDSYKDVGLDKVKNKVFWAYSSRVDQQICFKNDKYKNIFIKKGLTLAGNPSSENVSLDKIFIKQSEKVKKMYTFFNGAWKILGVDSDKIYKHAGLMIVSKKSGELISKSNYLPKMNGVCSKKETYQCEIGTVSNIKFLKGKMGIQKNVPYWECGGINGGEATSCNLLKYEYKEGLDVLTLRGGTDYQKGLFHGQTLKYGIQDLLLSFENIAGTKAKFEKLKQDALKFMPVISSKITNEIQGIAEGAGVSFADILLINTYDDLGRMAGCSSMIGEKLNFEGKQNSLIHTRNLDYFLPVLAKHNIVFKYDTHISVGFPGYIGVLTGFGEKGISLSSHTAYSSNSAVYGMPSGLLYRQIITETSNINEVKSFLIQASERRSIANILMIGSHKENKGIVAEFDPKKIAFREIGDTFKGKTDEKILVSTNHYRTLGMETVTLGGKNRRYDQYFQLTENFDFNGEVKVADLKALMGYYEETNPAVWDSIANNSTVQSVFMLPSENKIYVSNGKIMPVTTGKYIEIDF